MRFVVGAPGRADRLLAGAVEDTSRKLLARAFAAGKVRLNGRRARKGDAVVPGDVLEVDGVVGRAERVPVAQPELPLELIWHDDHLLAVDKPPGMPSHPIEPGERGTLANAIVARYPECATAGDDVREAGLAHRLDVDTSGVILVARRAAVWRALRAAFRERRIRKEYLALVEGTVDGARVIDAPIAYDRGGAGGVRVGERPGALAAMTEIHPERNLGRYSLVRCVARTGRMHQVRAHLAAAGHPCVGDLRYGATPTDLDTQGAFLHAARIELAHPVTGVGMVLESELPPRRVAVVEGVWRESLVDSRR